MKKVFILAFFLSSVIAGVLKPDEAFKFSYQESQDTIKLNLVLAKDIYAYKDKISLSLSSPSKRNLNFLLDFPKAQSYHKKQVYEKKLSFLLQKKDILKLFDGKTFSLIFSYQGCSKQGICYQPITKHIKLKAADNSGFEFKDKSFLWVVASFFGIGILLSLTPCVFPMIPILSSIIVSNGGEQMNAKKGFLLSLVYVFFMALAYAISGVIAGLFGSNLQTALQNPYVIYTFSGIFVILSLSMFGFYDLELPQSLQNSISKKSQANKGFIGVAIMGFLSALIVGPCVAAPVAGALIYIGQSGDALLGGAALFAMGFGSGAPLLLIGLSAGRFLPRPGIWMDRVKLAFGFVMLGIAIWMAGRVMNEDINLFLWALLFVFVSVYMGLFEQAKTNLQRFLKALALLVLLYGVLLFFGAFIGGGALQSPLKGLKTQAVKSSKTYEKVSSLQALEKKIKQAKKPLMLDFGAKWCASCKELEEKTFVDEKVKSLMSKCEVIKIDISKNSAQDKQMLKHFNLFGPPAILFFKAGEELEKHRVIGYVNANDFAQILQKVLDE